MGDSLPSNVRVSSSFDGLVSDLAAFVSQAADRAVAARGRFLLGLSGGSLPSTLSAALESAIESGKELHMDKWHVFYVDERVVPLDHKDSNHGACTAAIFGKVLFKRIALLAFAK
jgi:6-phosphogluconolactonase